MANGGRFTQTVAGTEDVEAVANSASPMRQFSEDMCVVDDGATPDPTSFCEPDVYQVDRKSAHNKNYVEFELAAQLDQQGKKLPGRIMLRDTCNLTYRQYTTTALGVTGFVYGSCPYTGTALFDNTNAVTVSPTTASSGSARARPNAAPTVSPPHTEPVRKASTIVTTQSVTVRQGCGIRLDSFTATKIDTKPARMPSGAGSTVARQMTGTKTSPPRMGACMRRIAPAAPGTKAPRLGTGRVGHAAWCMPSPRRRVSAPAI